MSNKFQPKEIRGFVYNAPLDQASIDTIIESSQNMDTQELQNAMTRFQIPLNITDSFGNNLIHLTLDNETAQKNEANRLNFIKFLVNNNVNPDAPNKDNNTPLHLAAKYQFAEIIKYLLELGVNPNYMDSLGNTPFHYFLNGKLKRFKNNHVYDLIPASATKFENEPISEESKKLIEEIQKELLSSISNKAEVISMEETIKKSYLINNELKELLFDFNLKDFSQSTKNLTDNILPFYNKIISIVSSNWQNFREIDDFEQFESKQDIHITLKSNVEESINEISKIIDNTRTNFNESPIFEIPKDFLITNPIEFKNIDEDELKTYIDSSCFPGCADAADNYINLANKVFIGGARVLNIKNDLDSKESCGQIRDTFITTSNTVKNLSKLVIGVPLNQLSNSVGNNDLPIQEFIYNSLFENNNDVRAIPDNILPKLMENLNNPSLNSFSIAYNLMMHSGSSKNNSFPSVNLSAVYFFAGYINIQTDIILSMTQSFKTILLHSINEKFTEGKDKISSWLYLMLSNKNFNELYQEIENQSDTLLESQNNDIDKIPKLLARYLKDLLNGNPSEENSKQLINFTKKEYVLKSEGLVYGISKYFDSMSQKPILNHVIDTIFVIRKLIENSDDLDNKINNFLGSLKNPLDIQQIFSDAPEEQNMDTFSYQLSNNILPSRKYLFEDNLNNENYQKRSKFVESYVLGLSYLTCFAGAEFYDGKINYEVQYNGTNLESVQQYNYLPYMGFIQAAVSPTEFNQYNNSPYFVQTNSPYNIGPSTYEGVSSSLLNLQNLLRKYFNDVLASEDGINFMNILRNTFQKNSKKFFKYFPYYYPQILTINQMDKELGTQFNLILGEDMILLENKIVTIVENINKINAYFFINYYLFTDGVNVKIPSFYYYKIPKPNSQEKSLIYEAKDDESNFLNNYSSNDDPVSQIDIDGERGQLGLYTSIIPSSNKFNYSIIQSIINGQKYITTNKINQFINISKKSVLPPSLRNYYYDFYKYSTLSLIIDMYNDSATKTLKAKISSIFFTSNTTESKEKVIKLKEAQFIESLLKNKFNSLIKNTSWDILTEKFKDNPLLNELTTKYTKDKPISIESIVFPNVEYGVNYSFFYRLSEKLKQENDFIIISNDYTNNILSREFQKLVIKDDILKILLENNGKPFIVNKENRSPIYSCLRNYYYKIFEALNSERLKYQQFYHDSSVYGIQQPLFFIFQEMKNHLSKLLFSETSNDKILNKFSYNQYEEVKLIISNNSSFGNNILRHLEMSYSIIGYIINQYLFRNLFDDSEPEKLIKILNENGINKSNVSDDNFFSYNNNINVLNYYNFLTEIIDEINGKIDKINNKIHELNNKEEKLVQALGKDSVNLLLKNKNELGIQKKNENKKRREIEKLLESMPKTNLKNKTSVNLKYNFINNLDRFLEINNNHRGSYLLYWKDYLENSNLDDDKNLLMINISKKIQKNLSGLNLSDACKGDLNKINENSYIFDHSSVIAEEYFKTPKYLNTNKLLIYIKKIIMHMTQNIICHGFEISLKKALFEHFDNEDPISSLRDIDLIFSSISNLRADGKDMVKTLYEEVAEELIMSSSSPIFKDRNEEINYVSQSAYEIFSNYVNLLELGPIKIDSDTQLRKNLEFIIKYYSEISPKIIYNWFVSIENYLKFVINQSRIFKTFNNLCL